MVAAPHAYDTIVGPGPTKRTQDIADLMRQAAEREAEWVTTWDQYLTTDDPDTKTQAQAMRQDLTNLMARAASLLDDMKRNP